MNKETLREALVAERFNPKTYSLDEEQRDEALCLRLEGEQWCVFYSEKGLQTGKVCFSGEALACEYFLSEMRSDPTTKLDWRSGFSMQ